MNEYVYSPAEITGAICETSGCMFKKILTSIMAIVLVAGLYPTVALADESNVTGEEAGIVTTIDFSANESTAISADLELDASLLVSPLATGDIASGTLGTCTWVIDSDGCLTITPEDGVSGDFYIGEYTVGNSWPWYSYLANITEAKIEGDVSASGSIASMFDGATFLEKADLSALDVANVKNMADVFMNCSFLESVDLSGWDTSNVTTMYAMFYSCTFLNFVDLTEFDTSKVTNMSDMFYNCTYLTTIDLSKWDTSNASNLSYMFSNCPSLTSLDISNWNVSNVTSMRRMFSGCTALTSLDISGWNLTNISDIDYMFYGCSALNSIVLSGWDTSHVTDMSNIFYNCSSLVSLDLSGWDTSHMMNASSMFYGCSSLENLNLSSFDTSHTLNASNMFSGCTSLHTVVVGEKFAFIDGNYLPTPIRNNEYGKWESADGTVYDDPSLLPNNVATTYTATFPTIMSIYAGSTRYATSRVIDSAIADESGYGSYEGVIVCSGENGKFADALCASGLSGVLGYPIVLVDGSYEPDPNGPGGFTDGAGPYPAIYYLVGYEGDIIILGGESTVNDYVTNLIRNWYSDGEVTRISGADRYATAEAVYEYGASHGGWSSDYAVLAKGNDFPDALGAASFCTTNKVPMLLTNQNDATLSSYITNAASYASEVLIVGGTTSVSTEKENTLRNYATVERFGEATRYETNLAFANWELAHGMQIDNAGIATGTNFPDSLGSSYLLSMTSSVLLLTSQDEVENAALYNLLADNAQSIGNINIFGGENSVTTITRSSIQTAIGGEWKTFYR